MKKHLIILVLFLVVPNLSFAKQLSKSPFIPDSVQDEFNELSTKHKSKFCGFENYKIRKGIINKDLAPKILGYNSRMDNWKIVEGNHSRDVMKEYLAAVTYASVTKNDEVKEFLFDKLYTWAKNNALSATKQCYTNSKDKPVLKDCQGEWSDPNGQDLAPVKDSVVAVQIVMGLNYIYNLNFTTYKTDDPRHKKINQWFKSFYKRIKPVSDFYFGNSAGWYFPNIALRHNDNKNYKSLVKKLIKSADKWILKDGSIKDRTTRGNRSLWYHHSALGEAFMIMEIANAANVKIPKNYEKNLLKAAELFQDGFLDNSILEPWAKKAHNAQPSNGIQKFNKNLNSITIDSQWFHIIQYRYPNHRTSKFLKTKLTTKAKSLKSSGAIAIGIGCIYNALANK